MITKDYYKESLKCFSLPDNTQVVNELLPEETRPEELISKSKISIDANIKSVKYEKRETPVIDARQFYTNKNGKIKSVRYQA